MGSFSAASGSIRDASFPRNAKASPACLPPPSPPPLPPPPPGAVAVAAAAAAAARASSNSRWTRLSMIETVRLSSPPPLHFQLRKNSYSRKRAIGQPACPNIASFLPTNRGAQTPDARSTPRLSVFYLDVAIVTAWFFLFLFLFWSCFFFVFFFFLQLDLSPSLRSAVSQARTSLAPFPILLGPTYERAQPADAGPRTALTDALSKSGSPLQTGLYHNRATAMT